MQQLMQQQQQLSEQLKQAEEDLIRERHLRESAEMAQKRADEDKKLNAVSVKYERKLDKLLLELEAKKKGFEIREAQLAAQKSENTVNNQKPKGAKDGK